MKNLQNEQSFRFINMKTLGQVTKNSSANTNRLFLLMFSGLLLTGCMKTAKEDTPNLQSSETITENTDLKSIYTSGELSQQTLRELQQVKAATGKYANLDNAYKDDYKDIGLKLENMGYHFLKAELVSPVFNLTKPAILVYNKRKNGSFELVSVEYAVPIDPQSPHTPPQGFTGTADEWDFNTLNTGWWTLHAWVWKFNPDGVFKPMNPLVIVQ
jgi:hypothetical protein